MGDIHIVELKTTGDYEIDDFEHHSKCVSRR